MDFKTRRVSAQWLSMLKALYGIFFGGLVAYAYFFLKLKGKSGGLELFGASCTVLFSLHLLFIPRLVLQGLIKPKILVRGLFFGMTQVLIVQAMRSGMASSAIVSSTLGSVIGVVLGRIYLKEYLKGLGIFAVPLTIGAVFVNPSIVFQSYFGVMGGIVQGSNIVLARSLMIAKTSIRQTIAVGFGVAAICSIIFSYGHLEDFLHIDLSSLLLSSTVLLTVQYAYFFLCKMLDSQRASILALSRVPWSMLLEWLFFGVIASTQHMVAALLIVASSIILVLDSALSIMLKRNKL